MKISTLIFICLLLAAWNSGIAQGKWIKKPDFGGGKRTEAVGFSIGAQGYLGTGFNDAGFLQKDFWEFDQETDSWTQIADFGGGNRQLAVAFSTGGKGYVGTGIDSAFLMSKDFWEYDPLTNMWTQVADFIGTPTYEAVAFAVAGKGYVGTGFDFSEFPYCTKRFYQYDPQTDTWLQIDDLPGSPRVDPAAFSIGGKGYVGNGNDNNFHELKDFYQYDPVAAKWTAIADFGGTPRFRSASFSINGKGYIGAGYDSPTGFRNDFWQYDPVTNQWLQMPDLPAGVRESSVGFSIGSKGYIGTGDFSVIVYKDFWEFTPEEVAVCDIPAGTSVFNLQSSSVLLGWEQAAGAKSYSVRYREKGATSWIITLTPIRAKKLTGLTADTEYEWSVKSLCDEQSGLTSDWSPTQMFITKPLRLENEIEEATSFDVFPNPVSSTATISFSLVAAAKVSIELFSVDGKKVMTIADESFSDGNHELNLNRTSLSAGIYFLQLKTDGETLQQKLVIQ